MSRDANAGAAPGSDGGPRNSAWMLALSLALVFVAGGLGSLAMPDAWYAQLQKPPLNPPGWVFGPVWTTLYALMAVAAWLVWREHRSANVRMPLAVYAVQLALNAIWSPLFFGLHRPDLALIDLIAMWCAVAVTLVLFWRVRPLAGGLLIPYLAWVSFAGYLNGSIWWLNRG